MTLGLTPILFCLLNTTHGYVPLHARACMSLSINDSFQNPYEIDPYQEFKFVEHTHEHTLLHAYTNAYFLQI